MFRRVLLKLSGEALAGGAGTGVEPGILASMASDIRKAMEQGIQVAVVIGGGNFLRGATAAQGGMDRTTGDHMGMLATVMNSLALRDALERSGVRSEILGGFAIGPVCPAFTRREALRLLESGVAVILAAGTGNPFFSTDTAAALRACEISADVILKATKVDGVYTADPKKDSNARRYTRLSMDEAIAKNLGVMDVAAFALCRENHIPILVFRMEPGNLDRVVNDPSVGTLVEP